MCGNIHRIRNKILSGEVPFLFLQGGLIYSMPAAQRCDSRAGDRRDAISAVNKRVL